MSFFKFEISKFQYLIFLWGLQQGTFRKVWLKKTFLCHLKGQGHPSVKVKPLPYATYVYTSQKQQSVDQNLWLTALLYMILPNFIALTFQGHLGVNARHGRYTKIPALETAVHRVKWVKILDLGTLACTMHLTRLTSKVSRSIWSHSGDFF